MKPSHFVSTASRSFLVGAISILFLFTGVVWLMAQGSERPYKGGGGHADIKSVLVPFVPGPKGKDGRVHQAEPSKNVVLPPRHMTKEGIEEKKLADEGKIAPSTKQLARQLTAAELSSLGVNTPIPKALKVPTLSSPSTSSAKTSNSATKGAANSPSSNFAGVGFTGFIPPDGGVAAGPFNVVAVVNSTINVYDKNGNLLSSQSLGGFFNGLPGAADGPFDPSVVYDADLGRFWVLATSAHDSSPGDPNNRSTLLVGISNGSDVTSGGWSTFWMPFDVDGDGSDGHHNGCDYPHFGIDAQAIYFSCNMFSFPFFSNSSSFQFAKVRIMTKSQFTSGPCCNWWEFWDLREGPFNSISSFTIRPAIMHFAGTGDGDFWVNAERDPFASNLKVRRLTNAQNCCNGIGPNLADADQGVGSFPSPPGAKQPGTSTTIDSGDNRLLFATWEFGHLSTGQTVACSQGGTNDACAAFTEIDVSAYPSMSNVNDWVYGQPAGEDVYYPYVEQNSNGDKLMVYSRSDATSTFAGAYYTTIPRSSSCTSCTGFETVMHAGEGTYVNFDLAGRNRWGDYMGAGADPDFLGIWGESEYATSSGSTWGTDIEAAYNSYVPSPAFSNNPVPFGNQTVFTSSNTMNEFFANNGNATLYTTFVFMSGDPDFVITFDGCSFQTIQPGSFCVDTIQFNPHSVGAGNATLNVDYKFLFNSFASTLSANVTGTGTQAPTSTSLFSAPNPSVFGQPVTLTATVTQSTSGNPTGTVTFWHLRPFPFRPFMLGTGTVNGGIATITTPTLGVGGHGIFASYNGDANFISSNSSVITQTVNKDASIATVTSSKNPSVTGSAVTFTARVFAASPGSGTPSGTVTFKDGATTLHSGTPLSGGKATFTISTLTVGNHPITVTYSGDGNFVGSASGTLTQMVRSATSTALSSSHNPSVFGQPVTFTATVSPSTATGTVTFKDGATKLGSPSLVGGKAMLSTSALTVGTHSITATYSGNGTFITSTSPALSQKVNKAASSTALSSSHNPSVSGQSVTFTATVKAVAPGAGTPTGNVTFKNGGVQVGSPQPLVGGKATLITSALTVGAHSITATYNGGVDFNTSVSPALTQTVNKAATTTTLTSSPNPSHLGNTVTFKATVAAVAPGSGTPTGTVTLKDGAVVLGTAPLVGGKATFSTSLLALGSHSMTAVYSGSGNDLGSTSPAHTQTVNR
jgi:hypothetical protein